MLSPASMLLASAALVPLLAAPAQAQSLSNSQIQAIVDAYANPMVQFGQAVGAGVAVVRVGQPTLTYAFGSANVATGQPFTADTPFQIASMTKVFTTNVLGQQVEKRELTVGMTLDQFSAALGTLKPLTGRITLQDLADFTSGIPRYAPLCQPVATPGCLPNARPSIGQYGAADFLAYFQNTLPYAYNVTPPVALTRLPGPYVYSNFSIGLLGLLLCCRDAALTNGAVNSWFAQVKTDLLQPLSMTSTYLYPPASPPVPAAAGYSPAFASATVESGGGIGAITVFDSGAGYKTAPAVQIVGGGGQGATAVARLRGGGVLSISVTAPGGHYAGPPAVVFNNGGSTSTASASAVVQNGQIVAFDVGYAGAGYVRAPTVTLVGGRAATGRDATATAHIANGQLTAITVTDGGAGYYEPLHVVVAPGAQETNVVPIWAAAGALTSTLSDMARFAQAALLERSIAGSAAPAIVTQGFMIAEAPRACAAANSLLSDCPATSHRVGLAWDLIPADSANGVPELVTKDGSLPGFSSQLVLAPSCGLGVVTLANSDDYAPASDLAFQIAYNLIYADASCR